jgi:peptide deformylase
MARLEIVEWPAKVLETKAEPVEVFDKDLHALVEDMFETMRHSKGIGLAANQVAVLKRLIVMHIPFSNNRYEDEEEEAQPWHNKDFVFINPEIIERKGKISYQEGCLSFPEIYDFVDRAAEIKVRAQNEKGEFFEVEADGLFSVCIQHEIDHIDGIVFINRMSRFKSARIKKHIADKLRMGIRV